MKKLVFWVVMVIIISSCKKEEIPIPRADRGGVSTQLVNMSTDYRYQLYYDLETEQIVGQNLKTDWDLGFQSGANEWQVTLNTAKYMAVWRTGEPDFNLVTDTLGSVWSYDNVRGKLDSTAIGNWQNTSQVYVVNRGFDWAGTHLGFFKMEIQGVNSSEYSIRVAELNGNNDRTLTILKNSAVNKTGFSFDNGSLTVEPPKTDWDLHFTQYTHVYGNGDTYLVTGILHNPFSTTVAKDDVHNFSELDHNHLSTLSFGSDVNIIGFDWKTYNFPTSSFLINSGINYVIETSDSRVFKIHFIDFYNQLGEKGFPTFELQEL